MSTKFASGEDFTLEDFLEQMMMIRKLGPIGNLLGMMPGMGQVRDQISQIDDRDLDRIAAIIRSMTPQGAPSPRSSTARGGPASRRARVSASARSTASSPGSSTRRR